MVSEHIQGWLEEIRNSFQSEDAKRVSILFDKKALEEASSYIRRCDANCTADLRNFLNQFLPRELHLVAQKYSELLLVYSNPEASLKTVEILYSLFNEILNPENLYEWWFLPLFRSFMKIVAIKTLTLRGASDALGSNHYSQATLFINRFHRKLASVTLQSLFRKSSVYVPKISHLDKSKGNMVKLPVLSICNVTLKFCLKMGERQLFGKLVEQFSRKNNYLSDFSISEVVTFEFFAGSHELTLNKFSSADKRLQFALRHCHKDAWRNKRRIFLRLFVVRLIRGFLPKSDAMKKYGYMETLGPLINAFKSGNIYEFERIHNSQRLLWASIGCFWIMKQRLSALLHRNLFRKVFLIARLDDPNRTQIELEHLKIALKFAYKDKSKASCALGAVLALIRSGYLRAYMLPGPKIMFVELWLLYSSIHLLSYLISISNASKVSAFPSPSRLSSAMPAQKNLGLFRDLPK